MAGDYSGIYTRNFGVEIEMTGITRKKAAEVIQHVLDGKLYRRSSSKGRDHYQVIDGQERKWRIMFDKSMTRCDENYEVTEDEDYGVELCTPVLKYEDIPVLQEIADALEQAGAVTGSEFRAGFHIHISGDDLTPQQVTNLVNIFSSKENYFWQALNVADCREPYCQRINRDFVQELNEKKPQTMDGIAELWYKHSDSKYKSDRYKSRYRFLNLHSLFQSGHYEIRGCNGTLDREEIHAYLSLFLGVNNSAMTKQRCSPVESTTTNMKYAVRVVLINLGLNGKEFASARFHLLKHLDGNSAWLNPESGVKQRERLKALRQALREQIQAPQESREEQIAKVYENKEKAHQSDSDGDFEYKEESEDMDSETGIAEAAENTDSDDEEETEDFNMSM